MTDEDRQRVPLQDAAEYIATLADELATMAASNRLDVLRFLLEMARDEAHSVARAEHTPPKRGQSA
ncbi:hypothetical protein [Ancylobacter sp.]|uniref:hypothetical protein n=1 Tax=Ancylobacter sp. TaxID=1872567 RepID=UPI003D12BA4F